MGMENGTKQYSVLSTNFYATTESGGISEIVGNVSTISNLPFGIVEEPDPYKEMKEICDIILGVLTILLFPFVVGGNNLILYILYRYPRLRTTTNVYIGSLAFSDAILGTFTIPIYILYYFHSNLTQYRGLCLFRFSSVMVSFSGSILSFLAIAIDRYVAVLYPLKYHTDMNRGIAIRIIIGIWIYVAIIGTLPFVWHDEDALRTVCQFFLVIPVQYTIAFVFTIIGISLLLGAYLYGRIFRVAFRMKQKMIERKNKHDQQMEKEKRSASTMGLVLLIFFIFWSPHLIGAGINYEDIHLSLKTTIKNFTLIIAMSNSGVNPFIYAMRKTDISLKFKTVLKHCFCQNTGRKKENNLKTSLKQVPMIHGNSEDSSAVPSKKVVDRLTQKANLSNTGKNIQTASERKAFGSTDDGFSNDNTDEGGTSIYTIDSIDDKFKMNQI